VWVESGDEEVNRWQLLHWCPAWEIRSGQGRWGTKTGDGNRQADTTRKCATQRQLAGFSAPAPRYVCVSVHCILCYSISCLYFSSVGFVLSSRFLVLPPFRNIRCFSFLK
jgi:hypothetical protein